MAHPLTSLPTPFPRPVEVFLAVALVLPWLLNISFGPTPAVLQACVAALAAVLWFALRPADVLAAARVLAMAWLAAASLNAAIAIVQYGFGISTNSLWLSDASVGEAYGNLRQRNQLATLLAIGLASAFFLAGTARGRLRWLVAACVVLMSAANALTSSRTGLLQWVAVCGLAFAAPLFGAASRWRLWALLGLGSYAATLLVAPPLMVWLTGEAATTLMDRLATDLGCVSRKVLWSNALYLAAQRPWTGWGLGEMDYAHQVTLYPAERFCLIVDNAHNLFLQVAVELGIPAALVLGAAVLGLLVRGRPWRERRAHRLLAWAVLAAVLLHSMVEYPLWYGPFQLSVLLAATLLWRGEGLSEGVRQPAPQGAAQSLALVLAAGAVGYVAWDYHRMSQLYLPEDARSILYRDGVLSKARRSLLFRSQVDFATFTTTTLGPDNARAMAALGERVLHYSPEPRVIEPLLDALLLAGDTERAAWHMTRFCVAFPEEYGVWWKKAAARGMRPLPPADPAYCPAPQVQPS